MWRWFLGVIVAVASGLFLIWVLLHLALAGLIAMAFFHILSFGFRGIEVYIIAAGVVFIAIAILNRIFIPRW